MTEEDTPHDRYYQQIEQEAASDPMGRLLCRYFRSRRDIIYAMREQHVSDEALLTFISNAFGIWGGGGLHPEGWYEYAGGKTPRLQIQDQQFQITHKLEGKRLVNTFRQLFRLHGSQLGLF